MNYQYLHKEFLIFSSHKTATQSTIKSLNRKGIKAFHCHSLRHINLKKGEFTKFLDDYNKENHHPLKIISTFREPISRLISSFFEINGVDIINSGQIKSKSESILHKKSIAELQKIFIEELKKKSLQGYKESLDSLCEELNINESQLNFNEQKMMGFIEGKNFKLYLFEFNSLINNFSDLISKIANTRINPKKTNISKKKWYKNIYKQFKSTLEIPKEIIEKIYEDKNKYIKLFYKNEAGNLRKTIINRYNQPKNSKPQLLNTKMPNSNRKQSIDSPLRSIFKSISWRIVATLTTILIAYFITGQIAISISIGGIEVITKMLLYYLHERAWSRIKYGKEKENSMITNGNCENTIFSKPNPQREPEE